MSNVKIVIPTGRGKNRGKQLATFARSLQEIQSRVPFAVSARGWCYQLEPFGLINKGQFDLVEKIINECRKKGYLPIDFTAEETARKFSGVEIPEDCTPIEYMENYLRSTLRCEHWYTPNWWKGESYYIQMVVEKIDLKTLFETVCTQYHIPIATSKGWSSMLQRATYAKRFKQAREQGLKCVLLYCGDHDPDGLRISEFLRQNLRDLRHIKWVDGAYGYNPHDLIIDRFGLNYDFIQEHNLTWIDNLITASKRDLASPSHPNHHLPYVQDYLHRYGARKCEANALVMIPDEARVLCREAIEQYLGADALTRFHEKRQAVIDELKEFRERTGLDEAVQTALEIIENQEAD